MSGFFPNRWLILAAVVVINMCAGSAYAWSVLQKPLQELFHWSTQETTMAFTISLAMLARPICTLFFRGETDLAVLMIQAGSFTVFFYGC